MKKKNMHISPIHADWHVFYTIQRSGKTLFCLHDRASTLANRTIAIELHDRNKRNYVFFDADAVSDLVTSLNCIFSGHIGRFAHDSALRKTYIGYDEIAYWRANGNWTPIFAPNSDTNPSDDELLDVAFRMISPMGRICYGKENTPFISYLRNLYYEEQRIFGGNPVSIFEHVFYEDSKGNESVRHRNLNITCIPYDHGKQILDPSWQLAETTTLIWVHEGRKDDRNHVEMRFTNAEIRQLITKCCRSLGVEMPFNNLE